MSPLRASLVLASAFCGDIVWVRWTLCANRHRALEAAAWGVGIVLLGAVSVTAYVDDPLYLVPAALGAGAGTFATVRHSLRKDLSRSLRTARGERR